VLVATLAVVLVSARPQTAGVGVDPVRAVGTSGNQSLLPLSAWAPISAAIGREDAHYAVAASGEAENPAQHLRLRFSAGGVRVGVGAASTQFALAGVGRGTSVAPAAPAAPRWAANRVLYDRGNVREWYVNGPFGLEQGFDVGRRPGGSGSLTLALRLSGGLAARATRSGIVLAGAGARLGYGGLLVRDARGRVLASSLRVVGNRILIRVDDRHALYPVRVDPWVAGSSVTPTGEVGDSDFGASVALSADGATAVVGNPLDNTYTGAAWVFVRSGTTWAQQGPKLTASDESGTAELGTSVAISADGNVVAVGGPADDNFDGAVWLFTRSGGTWSQSGAKLTAAGESGPGELGYSVAIAGDSSGVLAGAPDNASVAGAAWAFVNPGGGWTGTKILPTDETGPLGRFGHTVALSADGSTALVSARTDGNSAGAAFAFTRSGATWAQQGPKLTADDETGKAQFGYAAALSADGNTALIGGPYDNSNAGAAWIFARLSGAWEQVGSKLTTTCQFQGDEFGTQAVLAASGATALVGCAGNGAGVFAFQLVGATWTAQGPVVSGTGTVAVSADGNLAFQAGVAGGDDRAGDIDDVPEVDAVNPSVGPVGGGTRVVITGSNFGTVTGVRFGLIPAAYTVTSPTTIVAVAPPSGSWGLQNVTVTNSAGQSRYSGTSTYTYESAPDAPVGVNAQSGDRQATVEFIAESDGGSAVTGYTVTASPGGIRATGTSDAITVHGLSPGTAYRFTVTATNAYGTSPASPPSNAITTFRDKFVVGAPMQQADGSVVVLVTSPAAGTVSAALAAGAPAKAAKKGKTKKGKTRTPKQTPVLASVPPRASAAQADVVVGLSFKPNAAGIARLLNQSTIRVPVRITFTSSAGASQTQAATLVFNQPHFRFHGGTDGWASAWGDLTLASSTHRRHGGSDSLQVTIHRQPYPATDAGDPREELLRPGNKVSLWVYRPASTPPVGFWPMLILGSNWDYCPGPEVRPPANTWTRLTITMPSSHAGCAKASGSKDLVVQAVGVQIDDKGGVAAGRNVFISDVTW
jgi:hypothetical protein